MYMEEVINKISSFLGIDIKEATLIVEKAIAGGECTSDSLQEWYENRFLPNIIFIDEDGYASMCIDALKIIGTTAATDYGSSRQRDFGQIWADMTRGYLGELAFKIYLKEKFQIEVDLGHETGKLEDYLPTDIHKIKRGGSQKEITNLAVGIKATKWNGIWFDLPGDQYNHSDAHIFIKVGTGRDHLFAYFKKISVFRDKILKVGKDRGSLSENEADNLYNALPTFRPIPAYICGFILKEDIYENLDYVGKKGRKNFTIMSWKGPINPGDLSEIKNREAVSGKVSFEGIGNFSHDKGYLFNTGNLLWSKKDWGKLIDRL